MIRLSRDCSRTLGRTGDVRAKRIVPLLAASRDDSPADSEEETVEELTQVVERIEAYRERYDAESPGAVSLVDSPHEGSIEDV
jgi:hypothetical protein